MEDLIKSDIERARKYAQVVIEITPSGIIEHVNIDPGLKVIAVIGPSMLDCSKKRRRVEEVLLLEIGISRARPYIKSETPIDSFSPDMPRTIPRRRGEYFTINEKQYLSAGPAIWKHVQNLADERIKMWKRGPAYPIELPTPKTFLHARSKKITQTVFERKRWPKGARFSASICDQFVIQDVFYAELFGNIQIRQMIRGLSGFVRRVFDQAQYQSDDSDLEALAKAIKRRRIPERLIREVRRHMTTQRFLFPKDNTQMNILWQILFENLGLQENSACQELVLAESALPGVKERLGKIQLKVTDGLEAKKKYIVFEVYPSEKLTRSKNQTDS